VRLASFAFVAAILIPSIAWADRIAVVPLHAPGHPAPVVEADRLSAELAGRGHRVIAAADALARIASGNRGCGPDWGAEMAQTIGTARAALARLDRAFAVATARRLGAEITRHGGGAAGNDVLVEWYLLERQLSLAASDAKGSAEWLDAAVAAGPNVALDPLRHPDDERDVFARRRTELRGQAPAALSVSTVPPSADVWVDGVHRCASPCSVELVAGHHLALVSSAAHAPASFAVDVAPGTVTSRQIALSAAYAGAPPDAIASMLASPSRRAEGASALEPMARFLDVTHIVALFPEGDKLRVLVAPPAAGRSPIGPLTNEDGLSFAVADQLSPVEPARASGSAWYAKPATWIVGAAIIAGAVGGFLIYDASRPPGTGTLTVGSP
jgi:PEGA domain